MTVGQVSSARPRRLGRPAHQQVRAMAPSTRRRRDDESPSALLRALAKDSPKIPIDLRLPPRQPLDVQRLLQRLDRLPVLPLASP